MEKTYSHVSLTRIRAIRLQRILQILAAQKVNTVGDTVADKDTGYFVDSIVNFAICLSSDF